MLAVLDYSFTAVMPIILLILTGVLARRTGYLSLDTARKINRFNFRFGFCAMLFINIYSVGSISEMPGAMAVYSVAALSVLLIIGYLISNRLTEERFRKGVLIQSAFRSNYAAIGLPVAEALVGTQGAQMAAFLQLPIVIFFNAMSVVVLCIFSDYKAQYRLYGEGPLASAEERGEDISGLIEPAPSVDPVQIAKGVIENPLIQGILAGFAALLIRQVMPLRADGELLFSLQRDIPWLYSAIKSVSNLTIPIALIALGALLEMKEIKGFRKELIGGVLMRLVMAPVVGFALLFPIMKLGWMSPGRVEIGVLVAIFGSPLATSATVMSTEMGGDGHLCGQLVVWSSIFGMLSLFVLIFFLRLMGLL